MVPALIIVATLILVAGATLKGLSLARRRRMTRGIEPDAVIRAAWGVSLRVLCQGAPIFPSMSTSKANRTVGDVLVTADRLLIVCGRGVLVDIRPGRGKRLTSVRTPGPGMIVIEGTSAAIRGPEGRYRIEWLADDTTAWVGLLGAFAEIDNDGYGRAAL